MFGRQDLRSSIDACLYFTDRRNQLYTTMGVGAAVPFTGKLRRHSKLLLKGARSPVIIK